VRTGKNRYDILTKYDVLTAVSDATAERDSHNDALERM
jgi:hypothetical protein